MARISRHVHPSWLVLAVAAALALVGAAAWWYGRTAHPTRSAALQVGRPAAQPVVLRALAVATTVTAVAAAALAV